MALGLPLAWYCFALIDEYEQLHPVVSGARWRSLSGLAIA
jgi:hypothetical protein